MHMDIYTYTYIYIYMIYTDIKIYLDREDHMPMPWQQPTLDIATGFHSDRRSRRDPRLFVGAVQTRQRSSTSVLEIYHDISSY